MIQSKLPHIGTSIFTEISQLAREHQALDLGQGFPNFPIHPYLQERLNHYMGQGLNQYPPSRGIPRLLQAIGDLHRRQEGLNVDVQEEITITSGATEAIFCALAALVRPQDEVIMFDPAYDSYAPNIELMGGRAIRLALEEDFSLPWKALEQALSTRTRAIILNSPHNPSGKILEQQDLDQLWELIKNRELFILSDEVYQHILFDGRAHISPFQDPRFRERTFAVSSFGKTFHVTGWKVGYCLASPPLSKEIRKIHQYITFSTFTPAQWALADMITEQGGEVVRLGSFYQQKRDFFQQQITHPGWKLYPVEGGYFQLLDYSAISNLSAPSFCQKLIFDHRLASIPLDPFYQAPPGRKLIRLCFAKDRETLAQGAQRLNQIGETWRE